MKTFEEFIKESRQVLQYSGFNIPRASMPQIKNTDKFCRYLRKRNQSFIISDIRVSDIKPTQMEYDTEKVDKIKSKGPVIRPVVLSGDNHVIDGHHRYFAATHTGQETIPALVLQDTTAAEALSVALEYSSE